MMIMNYKKEEKELTNKKLAEKDKAKEEFNKKLGDIKFNRGVNFSIEYLKDDDINYIKFENMEHKPNAKNISLYYNEEYNCFNSIMFEIDDYSNFKTKDLSKELIKKYKLELAVKEIEMAHQEYKEELNNIDKKYEDIENQSITKDPELELKKVNN